MTDLVVLLGTGSVKAQELVTQLMRTLCAGAANRKAIASSGAMEKLMAQVSSNANKEGYRVVELAAAVLSALSSDAKANVSRIAKIGGVQKMVDLLKSPNVDAHEHAAAIIADLSKESEDTHDAIMSEGAIDPLVALLSAEASAEAKGEAAGALGSLCDGRIDTTLTVLQAGAIEPITHLLREPNPRAQRKAAAALAIIVKGDKVYQDAVARVGGIPLLVELLDSANATSEVQTHAAMALSELSNGNVRNQTAVLEAGGIPLLVTILQCGMSEALVVAAASAVRSITDRHSNNKSAVAAAGGTLQLVWRIATDSLTVQTAAAHALCTMTTKNADNQKTTATLLAKLLGSKGGSPERAARAIAMLTKGSIANQEALAAVGVVRLLIKALHESLESQKGVTTAELSVEVLHEELAAALRGMARDHPVNQAAIAAGGGIELLVALLTPTDAQKQRREASKRPEKSASLSLTISSVLFASKLKAATNKEPTTPLREVPPRDGSPPATRRSMISTHRSSGRGSPPQSHRSVVPATPASPPSKLSRSQTMLSTPAQGGATEEEDKQPDMDGMEREAAGALWCLAADESNRTKIADLGAIPTLIYLMKEGGKGGTQETATGLLVQMAETLMICEKISAADPITACEIVLDQGVDDAKTQASALFRRLAFDVPSNQIPIATALVNVMSDGGTDLEMEYATQLVYDLVGNDGARDAMADAGAVPYLVTQIETANSDQVSANSAHALFRIAKAGDDKRSEVTHQLICARHRCEDPQKEVRVSRVLSELNSEENETAMGLAILMFRLHTRD